MGVSQLCAATAMAFASHGSAPWRRFWRSLGLVAGVKTLLECVALSMPYGSSAERAVALATFAVVGLFVWSAVSWWRRGDLRGHPPLTATSRVVLLVSLALWAVFALAPRVLASF